MEESRQRRSHSILPSDAPSQKSVKRTSNPRKSSLPPSDPLPSSSSSSSRPSSSNHISNHHGSSSRRMSSKSHFVSSKQRRRRRGSSQRTSSSKRMADLAAAGIKTSQSSGGTLPRGGGKHHRDRSGLGRESQSSSLAQVSSTSSSRTRTHQSRQRRSTRRDRRAEKMKMREEAISELTPLLCATCKIAVAQNNTTAAKLASQWKSDTDKVSTILKKLTTSGSDDEDDDFWNDAESGEISRSDGGGDAAIATLSIEDWTKQHGEISTKDIERTRGGGHVRNGWHISSDGKTMSLHGLPSISMDSISPTKPPTETRKDPTTTTTTTTTSDGAPPSTADSGSSDTHRVSELGGGATDDASNADEDPTMCADDVASQRENPSTPPRPSIMTPRDDITLTPNPLHDTPRTSSALSSRLETKTRHLAHQLVQTAAALAEANNESPILPPPEVMAYLQLISHDDAEETVNSPRPSSTLGAPPLSHKRSRSLTTPAQAFANAPPPSPRQKAVGTPRDKEGKRKKKKSKLVDIRSTGNSLLGASVNELFSGIEKGSGLLPPSLQALLEYLGNPDVVSTPGLFAGDGQDDPTLEQEEQLELLNEALSADASSTDDAGANLDAFGPSAAASFFARFFLELQEPLLPFATYAVAVKVPNIEDERFLISALHSVVVSLPPMRRHLLVALICWCELVLSRCELNGCTGEGLATRFGPLVVRPPFTQWLRPAKNKALLSVAAARSGDRREVDSGELVLKLSLAGGAGAESAESSVVDQQKEEDLEKALRQYGKPSSGFFLALLRHSKEVFCSFPEYARWHQERIKAAGRARNKRLDPSNRVLDKASQHGKLKLVNSWVIDEGKGKSETVCNDGDGGETKPDSSNGAEYASDDASAGTTAGDDGPTGHQQEKETSNGHDDDDGGGGGGGGGDGDVQRTNDGSDGGEDHDVTAPATATTTVEADVGPLSECSVIDMTYVESVVDTSAAQRLEGVEAVKVHGLLQAATLDRVVEKMMDGVYIKCVEKGFHQMVFTTHYYFVAPEDLLGRMFKVLFDSIERDEGSDSNAWILTQGRSTTMELIETWLRHHFLFSKEPLSTNSAFEDALLGGLDRMEEKFSSTTRATSVRDRCRDVVDLWKRQKKMEKKAIKARKKNPVPTNETKLTGLPMDDDISKNKMLSLSPKEIATCLTIRAEKLYSSIPHFELVGLRFQEPNSAFSANVVEFNRCSLWVGTQVLRYTSPQDRAKVISHFIHIAIECKKLGNFNTLFAILSGLDNTAIARLEASWKGVNKATRKKFAALKILMDPASNFNAYRKEFAKQALPRLPVLAVISGDLITVHEQKTHISSMGGEHKEESSSHAPSMVHLDKLRAVYEIVESYFVGLGYEPNATAFPYEEKLESVGKSTMKEMAAQLSPSALAGEKELFGASKRAEPRK